MPADDFQGVGEHGEAYTGAWDARAKDNEWRQSTAPKVQLLPSPPLCRCGEDEGCHRCIVTSESRVSLISKHVPLCLAELCATPVESRRVRQQFDKTLCQVMRCPPHAHKAWMRQRVRKSESRTYSRDKHVFFPRCVI